MSHLIALAAHMQSVLATEGGKLPAVLLFMLLGDGKGSSSGSSPPASSLASLFRTNSKLGMVMGASVGLFTVAATKAYNRALARGGDSGTITAVTALCVHHRPWVSLLSHVP